VKILQKCDRRMPARAAVEVIYVLCLGLGCFSSVWGFGFFVSIAGTDRAVMYKSVYFAKVGIGFIWMTFAEFVLGA